MDQLVRWHPRLVAAAQVLRHNVLLERACADLGSLIYFCFEHEEVGECAVVLTAERLAGDEWRENTLLSVSAHLPQHVLIILIFVI